MTAGSAARTRPPETVWFISDGLKIVGDLYVPSGARHAHPVVVLCPGWVGGKYHRSADLARGLVNRGIAMLSFEYRGWGDSEGDRTRLLPAEHVRDARAAIGFLRSHSDVDPDRIVLLGKEHGAAVALQAAIDEPCVRGVACLFPVGDGGRWMRSIRRPWEWQEFTRRIDEDRVARCRTGASELIDPSDVLLVDPATEQRRALRRSRSSEYDHWRITLESADALVTFRPIDSVHRLAPRPVLLVTVENDNTVPIEEVERLFGALQEPKRIVVLQGIDHYAMYEPRHLEPVMDEIATFVLDASASSRVES